MAIVEVNKTILCSIPTDDFLFDSDGVIQPAPCRWWGKHSRCIRMAFGHLHALYAFPTIEIIDHLKGIIDPTSTIEIGAGNGGFCKALGIKGTDNHMQAEPGFRHLYEVAGQPTVNYGQHVEKADALEAIKKYRPKAVLASWVTHRYDPRRHECGGNIVGVDEHKLLELVDDYYFIGNTKIHASKPIFQDIAKRRITSHYVKQIVRDGVVSRASGGEDVLIHISRR